MAQTVEITLTTAGMDTGPFDLYSNIDGYATPFEDNVSKAALEAGYISVLVPDDAIFIRVQSDNPLCDNYIDLMIGTTTTTTSGGPSTTTTTTTMNPGDFDFYLAEEYDCSCVLLASSVTVAFSAGSVVNIGRYYPTVAPLERIYRITSSGAPIGIAPILTTVGSSNVCLSVPCVS